MLFLQSLYIKNKQSLVTKRSRILVQVITYFFLINSSLAIAIEYRSDDVTKNIFFLHFSVLNIIDRSSMMKNLKSQRWESVHGA